MRITAPRLATRLCVLLVLLIAGVLTSARARAEDLTRYCGHPVESRNIRLLGSPLDPSMCTTNCFRFALTCNNGRTFNLTSRFNPKDPDWLHWFAIVWPLPQLIVFGVVAFLTFVMGQGKPRKPGLNFAYLGIVGLTMFFWRSASTADPSSFSASMVFMGNAFMILGFPAFVLLNLPALMRGWDYLFVGHAAEPIITPALQSGTRVNTNALAKTLADGARSPGGHAAYHYENQAEKAQALKHQLDAARAEMAAAERALQEAKQRAERRS